MDDVWWYLMRILTAGREGHHFILGAFSFPCSGFFVVSRRRLKTTNQETRTKNQGPTYSTHPEQNMSTTLSGCRGYDREEDVRCFEIHSADPYSIFGRSAPLRFVTHSQQAYECTPGQV